LPKERIEVRRFLKGHLVLQGLGVLALDWGLKHGEELSYLFDSPDRYLCCRFRSFLTRKFWPAKLRCLCKLRNFIAQRKGVGTLLAFFKSNSAQKPTLIPILFTTRTTFVQAQHSCPEPAFSNRQPPSSTPVSPPQPCQPRYSVLCS